MKKEYTNGEVTVTWVPAKCIHSGICVRGIPDVFKPKEQPWIKIDMASSDAIVDQVKKCPSGALGYYMNNEKITSAETKPADIEVEVVPGGPYLVKGSITIIHADGRREEKQSTTAFCRCGASSTKPFCDGSHRISGFTG